MREFIAIAVAMDWLLQQQFLPLKGWQAYVSKLDLVIRMILKSLICRDPYPFFSFLKFVFKI